jgi:uncharacterized membrane protein (DUF373 family)
MPRVYRGAAREAVRAMAEATKAEGGERPGRAASPARPDQSGQHGDREGPGGAGEQPPEDGAPPSIADAVAQEEETPGTRAQQGWVERIQPLFDGAVLVLFVVVGVLLLAVAIAALGYALATIPKNLGQGMPQAISALLSELLLVLIIVEVLRTILTYISTHTTSIRPFLTVAVISSVRRILSIGAELSLVEDMPEEHFRRAMIELGAEGFIILAVAIALFLFSRREGG